MEGVDWAAGVTTSKQIDAKSTTHLTMCTDMFLLLDSMEKYYERSGGKSPRHPQGIPGGKWTGRIESSYTGKVGTESGLSSEMDKRPLFNQRGNLANNLQISNGRPCIPTKKYQSPLSATKPSIHLNGLRSVIGAFSFRTI
jgi:hypothetical protein